MTALAAPATPAAPSVDAPAPAAVARRGRVCMFVWNTFETDARVTREAKALLEDGWDVWIVAVLDEANPKPFERRDGMSIVRVGGLRQRRVARPAATEPDELDAPPRRRLRHRLRLHLVKHWLRFGLYTLRFLRAGLRCGADVYHSHDLNMLLPGAACATVRGVPLVYDSHEIHADKHGRYVAGEVAFWAAVERLLIRRVARCITTTHPRGQWLADHYAIRKPTILHNYAEFLPTPRTTALHERLGLPAGTPIVLYQGGIQPHRGLEQIVEAAEHIDPRAVVVLLGKGRSWGRVQRMVRQRGLEDRVRLVRAVPYEELRYLTASAAVGLQVLQNTCFNHWSTDSNKLFEYFMAGVPVVASDFPVIRSVVRDSGAGELVDPHDPRQIAAAVNRVLHADDYEGLCARAREAALRYNWDREKGRLQRLYAGLARRRLTSRRRSP